MFKIFMKDITLFSFGILYSFPQKSFVYLSTETRTCGSSDDGFFEKFKVRIRTILFKLGLNNLFP